MLNFYDFFQVFVFTTNHHLKVAIVTDLGPIQNQHKMLKIQQTILKLYMRLLYVVFNNFEPQNAGFIDVKKRI